LVISGADTDELKLSVEDGAYIVNAGTLYTVDTRLTGWSMQKNAPELMQEKAPTFRPFIATWSRSVTNMANTEFLAMGYNNSKSYGLTISS
ncbi:hypothetical protein NL361_27345, partial [Klebsiella pneumoniae]|nr:hypothetical protein [Klebsiella pneumoniae]